MVVSGVVGGVVLVVEVGAAAGNAFAQNELVAVGVGVIDVAVAAEAAAGDVVGVERVELKNAAVVAWLCA